MAKAVKHKKKDYAKMLANEKIETRNIAREMKESGLAYAVYTYVSRAIPDVRDGLKPSQRRIIYSMYDEGIVYEKPHSKSAGTTGDVMKRFHPHGDTYGVLVNLTDEFGIRYPVINGQGSFGSPDGDPPASARYTEVRLAKFHKYMFGELSKKGVNGERIVPFIPTYTQKEDEPTILPMMFPFLLANGAKGMSVGYTTNIPSHNIHEVIDAIIATLRKPNITVSELLQYIKGPDLASGGVLLNTIAISQLYETGEASLRYRAKVKTEVHPETGNNQVIIYELPPETNKPKLVETIYDLAIEKKVIPKVLEVRDESDGKINEETGKRDNLVRIVLELHKTAVPDTVIRTLFTHAPLEKSLGYKLRAVVDNAPLLLNLKQIINYYINHQYNVLENTFNIDVGRNKARLHILEGFRTILDYIDEVIRIIRNADSDKEAGEQLQAKFGLTDIQTSAILDMKLRQITKMEAGKIHSEIAEKENRIQELELLLKDPKTRDEYFIKQLRQMKKDIDGERKTEVLDIDSTNVIGVAKEISQTEVVTLLTSKGTLKQITTDSFDKMVKSKAIRERSEVYIQSVRGKMSENIILFLDTGEYVKVTSTDVIRDLPFIKGKQIISIAKDFSNNNVVTIITKSGAIKKTLFSKLKAKPGKIDTLIKNNSEKIVSVVISDHDEKNIITISTKNGIVHRFNEKSFSATSPGSGAIPSINLDSSDEVVDINISKSTDDQNASLVLFIHGNGKYLTKKMKLSEFTVKNRVAKGVIGIEFKNPGSVVVGSTIVKDGENLSFLDEKGNLIKTPINSLMGEARGIAKATPIKEAPSKVYLHHNI